MKSSNVSASSMHQYVQTDKRKTHHLSITFCQLQKDAQRQHFTHRYSYSTRRFLIVPALPILKIEPALPMLKMLPVLPMLRMLPELPILRMLPKLAMLRMLPALNALRMLNALCTLKMLAKLRTLFQLLRPEVARRSNGSVLLIKISPLTIL